MLSQYCLAVFYAQYWYRYEQVLPGVFVRIKRIVCSISTDTATKYKSIQRPSEHSFKTQGTSNVTMMMSISESETSCSSSLVNSIDSDSSSSNDNSDSSRSSSNINSNTSLLDQVQNLLLAPSGSSINTSYDIRLFLSTTSNDSPRFLGLPRLDIEPSQVLLENRCSRRTERTAEEKRIALISIIDMALAIVDEDDDDMEVNDNNEHYYSQ
jgi:hypothetical protein